jgi:long-chain fatty acid transport protein
MMSRTATLAASLAILFIIALADSARAGGLYITEFGTSALGTANAGANAGTDDASTAIHNPAGMTRLDDHHLSMGAAPAAAIVKFDPDSDTPVAGTKGGDQGGFLPIMGSQYVHKLSDRWRLGIGMLSFSGAALDPSDDWVGRNETTYISLATISVMPTIAYRVTDWLSIGAGPLLSYGKMTLKLKAAVPGEPKIVLNKLDDFAVGGLVSALFELSPKLRVGLTYQSKIEYNLDGDIKLPLGLDPSINLDLPLAQLVRWGIHWDVTDRIALLLSGDWEDWSVAKSLPISTGGGSAAIPLKFKDTWKGSIGMHYRLNKEWLLQTGFTYDTSALNDKDRTVALPVDRQTRLGFGAQYDWSDSLRIGMSFEWLNLGKNKVNTQFVKGDYSTNDIFFFGFNMNWKKLPWSGWGTF